MSKVLNELFIPIQEFTGRRRLAPQITFSANEIYYPIKTIKKVSFLTNALYVNLTPKLYAVAVSPEGSPFVLRGGINYPLASGKYSIYYVSKEQRQAVIPKVSETTADGAQVSLELIINYRVADPVKALEVEQPVESLIAFIKADLQEYIRSNTYDEILGDGATRRIDDDLISRYIKEKHNTRHQLSKLFFIADIAVDERTGDPKLIGIRENYQVQQRQQTTDNELLKQKQDLEKKVTLQEAEIRRIKAESDATQQDIRQKMELQMMELEKARAEMQYRQDRMQRAMSAVAQAFSSNYPKDPGEVEIINQLLNELGSGGISHRNIVNRQEDPASDGSGAEGKSQRIDNLTDTLLRWLNHKSS
ncbi:MAG TPA: hypothetical protein VLA72_11985 [Anaerolineales bacterium]|nr:hypothetical protein [Anaerolineales bacterium]